jgi:hypothetical protein
MLAACLGEPLKANARIVADPGALRDEVLVSPLGCDAAASPIRRVPEP